MSNIVRSSSHSPLQQRDQEKRSQDALLPAVDIFEESDVLKLVADMPGVTHESLKVEIDNNVLSLEGDIALNMPEGLSALHAEVRGQRFARRFNLSHEIDGDAITATIVNGVLTLTLPKKDSHRTRRIEVQAA
ncbi:MULTISPECIES: Hsp20/alpha crystallin family protein [Chromohalobacter]|jgi:HSP20 family molecular chaperone IbpA|uniref:Heat shock protein Hsp20 n=1 Tax=Chromohalobacter israelensis (strain ATCC BAA-138 / DSM 3043 / CIP 106854 / NCIMB 13768 / 1H11) TaxID=290398 RepID=Q1QSF9_CHRI1|nr:MULTISPECIES: Hsp20/alpha crystallin family protein [Chromohalobacter]ABE60599.1 heat shock protein Hsp20 [Chromohalobacter salexigens DSM 3043]MBZ5875137.1 Hsp20/alpha crystallin family protein [Chromohalobacter salexigens]MDO0945559.1 Hsp20/alpha crystallin family protein [Chromohalobacter salexigens]NQY45668.1 Hsp20/alpha crystallin family protein [Chromohalobacter sp.]NWO55258.1 Hsp20/alpha crystallin family protein [Chromohalobacter salexigens]